MTPSKPLSPEAEKFRAACLVAWNEVTVQVGYPSVGNAALDAFARLFDSHQSARIQELADYKRHFCSAHQWSVEARPIEVAAKDFCIICALDHAVCRARISELAAQVEALTKENEGLADAKASMEILWKWKELREDDVKQKKCLNPLPCPTPGHGGGKKGRREHNGT